MQPHKTIRAIADNHSTGYGSWTSVAKRGESTTIESAKLAAQEHFEKLILSCFEAYND